MPKLLYTVITSLDGYVNDEDGRFEWAAPDRSVHAFVNDLERPIGTYLYGRRLYETMVFWETVEPQVDQPEVADFAALWRAAAKVVYSTSLGEVTSARTRLERTFDVEAVRALKVASDRDLSIGGSELAAHAFRAGLVDEIRMFLNPVSVGGGSRFLPDGVRLNLELLEEHRFDNGVVYVRYNVNH